MTQSKIDQDQSGNKKATSWLVSMGRTIKKSVQQLFVPEEVEVTFKKDGSHITYTYTKVSQKQVA